MAKATPEFPKQSVYTPAVDYFRQKVNLPTRTWDTLWQGMHARSFVIAGAMKSDLLSDLRKAVDNAIAKGESYEAFRKRFVKIAELHKWQYNGSPGWRSRVIWHTNLRTAHAAGRYKEMTEPATLAHMPWWMYDHTTIQNPREQHKHWDNLVLRYDNPFWKTNYPPNGWGCNCRVVPLSDRQMRKLKPNGPDQAPEGAADDVPEEWRYNVGEASSGLPRAAQNANEGWEDLTNHSGFSTAESLGLPLQLPARPISSELLHDVKTAEDAASALTKLWGEKRLPIALFDDKQFRYPVTLDADYIADHYKDAPARLPWLGHLATSILDPDEVWLSFVRSRRSGKVALRMRIFRTIQNPDSSRKSYLGVLDAIRGEMVSYSAMPRSDGPSMNAQRQGRLLYSRYRQT